MSREIKFRAWDKEESRMCFFREFSIGTNAPSTELRASMYDPSINLDDDNYLYNTSFDTDEPILMQFTGLKDKNGVEIYEGDIVGIDGKPLGKIVAMKSDDDFPTAGFTIQYYNPTYPVPIKVSEHYEVMGNIYENPELLEQPNE